MSKTETQAQAQIPAVKNGKPPKEGAIRDRKQWTLAVEKMAQANSINQFVRCLDTVFSETRKRIAFKDKATGEIKWKHHGGVVTRLVMPVVSIKGSLRVQCSEELPISEQMSKLLGALAQELMTDGDDQVFIVRHDGDSFNVITVNIGTDEWMRKVLRFSRAQSWEA